MSKYVKRIIYLSYRKYLFPLSLSPNFHWSVHPPTISHRVSLPCRSFPPSFGGFKVLFVLLNLSRRLLVPLPTSLLPSLYFTPPCLMCLWTMKEIPFNPWWSTKNGLSTVLDGIRFSYRKRELRLETSWSSSLNLFVNDDALSTTVLSLSTFNHPRMCMTPTSLLS